MNFSTELARWNAYVGDYCSPPQLWRKASGQKTDSSKIPSPVATVVRLMRLGMTEQEAWATPVGIASWYEAAAYEADNSAYLDIVSDSERIAILRHKARQAAQQEQTANG